jgi:hypothetical protein
MHKTFPVTTALATAITLIAATPSAAAVVTKVSFQEEAAVATFFESIPIECEDGTQGTLETSIFVAGLSRVVRRGGTSPAEAFVSYAVFNRCTGQTVEAFPVIINPDYQQSGTDSATLNLNVELIADLTGESLGFLEATLVFTGIGPVTQSSTHSIFRSGNTTIKFRDSGERRQAEVTGSITVNGVEFIDNPGFSQLSDVRTGEMTVQR